MQNKPPFFWWVLAIVALRLLASVSMGLMPQDAYYYYYSENLDFSFFDHPPMVALMLKFFSLFLGKSVLAVKLSNFFTTILSLFVFYKLSLKFLSKPKAWLALILFGTTLLVTVLSINTTPDVPLILWWTISLLTIYTAIRQDRFIWWALVGLSIGLTFDSKYSAVFLLLGLLVLFVWDKSLQKKLFSYRPLVVLLFFALAISPLIYWNIQHDWVSFRFQLNDRASSVSKFIFNPKLLLGSIGSQLMLIIPVSFCVLWVIYYKFLRAKATFSHKFLMAFSLPLLLFFTVLSPIYWVKINWMMPAYISAFILLAIFIKEKYVKWHLVTSFVLHLILAIQIVFFPVNINSDDTWWGWPELNQEVEKLSATENIDFVFAADNYKTTACLNFYNKKKVFAGNVIGQHALQYSVLDTNLTSLNGKTALFIDSDTRFKDLEPSAQTPELLNNYFESVEQLSPITLEDKSGKTLRKFYVYKCKNYSSLAPSKP